MSANSFNRHVYGFELEWVRMQPLVISLSEVFNKFQQEISALLDYLNELDNNTP